ncbi:MAG: glycosyltransferase family 4 protein [Acidimicrobiales bacterium]
MTPARIRLGFVVSHPIQYHAPLFRRLDRSDIIDLEVLFLSRHGVEESYDAGFDAKIAYDVPLLDGFRHRFVPNWSPVPSPGSPLGLVNPGLAHVISRDRFDVLLVHGYAQLSCWLTFAAASARRLPYLLRGESRMDHEVQLGSARRRAKQALLRPLVRHAAGCLAIGSGNREFYLAYGARPERVSFAPYSVDNEAFAASGDVGRATRTERLLSLGLDPLLPVVLFAGKLQPWKRPLDLVDAATCMERQANFVFVGDGPLRSDLQDRTAGLPHARVVGFVNQREIGQWYGMADVFVLPSATEPWGLAVNEAMASGAVPVVSDAVGCADDLVDDATGAVVPVGAPADLAAALDRILSSPDGLRARRERARERVGRFSLEATAAGIEAASVAAVAGARSRR